MGVLRLMGTLLRHPATASAMLENVPVFECLLIDYNANIHYIMQKTVTELNEILYFTYYRENNIANMLLLDKMEQACDYNLNLELSQEEIEDRLEYYQEEYNIGSSYDEISARLSVENCVSDIIYSETIVYTRMLICSLNRGWIKKVYLALDGTPSMAKIKEQKNRRYISAHINNIRTDIVKKLKFRNADIYQIDLFYFRSAICTGTKFMDKIQQALFNLEIGLDIDVSTLNIKGEGEKKIIHAMDDYSHYNSFCIMSPDSDMLILIGLLSHKHKFDGKELYNFRIDYQKKNQYQFFNLRHLLDNLRKYFSQKIGKEVTNDKMLDLFFMLVVFGNDFLPKLEPLDITKHFDFVCESCLKISTSGTNFINNGNLNYQYLLEFFKLINNEMTAMCIEQSLSDKYNNYYKLCKQMSITNEYMQSEYHHPSLTPVHVNAENFYSQLKILNSSYTKLITFLKQNIIHETNIETLYKEIHQNPEDSYLILVAPRMVKFPGSNFSDSPRFFLEKLIMHTNSTDNFSDIKFRNKLMPKEYSYNTKPGEKISTYISEIEKLNKSLEPYRSIFRMSPINLVQHRKELSGPIGRFEIKTKNDLNTSEFVDNTDKYYQIYVKNNISQSEITQLVIDYLVGIEWLYQYYITGEHLEWSGWCYNCTQPPLMIDIIKYLENHPDCQSEFVQILQSYPPNEMSPLEHYLFVTPNEYTGAGVAPNLADVVQLIDGFGAAYINKCQIKWHEYQPK